jgi:hypothetical protein
LAPFVQVWNCRLIPALICVTNRDGLVGSWGWGQHPASSGSQWEIATQTRDRTFADHVPAQLSEHGLGDFGCKHKVHEIRPAPRQSGLGLYLPKRRPGGVDPTAVGPSRLSPYLRHAFEQERSKLGRQPTAANDSAKQSGLPTRCLNSGQGGTLAGGRAPSRC